MKILYSHFGRKGKDGWGRSFYMAKAMANLGHDVVFLTTKENISFFKVEKENLYNVSVLSYPDFMPSKLKSSGFGFISLIGKLIYTATHKFDLVISDCGHRPSGLPCKLNRKIYKSIYLSEWWDYFGKGGYYDNKPMWFKLLYGNREKKGEVKDKINADGVIVLSEQMKKRAIINGVKNVIIVHGGCLTQEIKPTITSTKIDDKLNLCYIGMADSEVNDLDPFLNAISKKEIRNKIRFITYGSKINNEYIKKYNLEGVIEERGWINYLKESYKLDDVDIHVQIRKNNIISRAGWPNKIGDYLANGKPILIYPYGDLIKFTSDNPEGFIVTQYDSNQIYKNINQVLSGEYNLQIMGDLNRKLAKKNTWEIKAQQIIEFHKSIKSLN